MTTDHDLPRVRALALGAVVLVVTAAGAVAGDGRGVVLATTALLLGSVAAARWRRAGRTALSSSAAVASLLVALLVLEELVTDVDVLLATSGVLALGAGVVLRERRLAVSGLLSFAALLGRPLAGGPTFSHCLVATDLAIPVPRLDGPTWVAVAAVAVGSLLRWTGWAERLDRASVARGMEVTGAVGLATLLVVRAAELPGHRVLCGSGDALDEGWFIAGVALGVAAGLYGLAARDIVWEGVGLVSLTAQGLVATTLTGSPWWAVACAVLVVGALLTAEWLRVPWPDDPGYELARPTMRDLRDRARRRERRP